MKHPYLICAPKNFDEMVVAFPKRNVVAHVYTLPETFHYWTRTGELRHGFLLEDKIEIGVPREDYFKTVIVRALAKWDEKYNGKN